jgi:hypothetical protein
MVSVGVAGFSDVLVGGIVTEETHCANPSEMIVKIMNICG